MKTIFSFNLKFIVILFILVIESKNCIAQKNEPWIRFFDTTNNKSGYKDLKGNVKITPKFDGFTRADTFYNIIGAYEMFEKELHAFYVLKNGRKLAKDSVFGIEGSPDCESEEKIIFSDWKKDKVGFLNKNGKVIVPAIYNWVQPFRNGISVALRNAKRECIPEGKDSISCEHSYFKGGETVLINERNEILVDSVNVENIGSINWYSKIISKKISDTTIYVSLKGKNNMFYSFIDYTKEFKNWYYNSFLHSLEFKNNEIKNYIFEEVFVSNRDNGKNIPINNFLKFLPSYLNINRFTKNEYNSIYVGGYVESDLDIENKNHKKYFGACGEQNIFKYPGFSVEIYHYKSTSKEINRIYNPNDISFREIFKFIRTETGYKLYNTSSY